MGNNERINKTFSIKCQYPNCRRQGAKVKVLTNGEKVLSINNTRHDGQIHLQEFTEKELTEMLKQAIEIREVP